MVTPTSTIPQNAGSGAAQLVQAQQAGAPVGQDPAVTAALEESVRIANRFGSAIPVASEFLTDPAATQAQRDEYVARLIEFAGMSGQTTASGIEITPDAARNIRQTLELLGESSGLSEMDALGQQVTESIARGVDNGRISADDLYNIIDPSAEIDSDGARGLLTGVTDANTLTEVAGLLLRDSRRLGYDDGISSSGIVALTAAADVANMAAANGRPAAANAVLDEIGRLSANGDFLDGASITDAMMLRSNFDLPNGPDEGRSGFEVLARLVNSATPNGNDARQIGIDNLFATLVRSGDGGWPMVGTAQEIGVTGGLSELGEYFNSNLPRLMEQDLRNEDSNSPLYGLVQDFVRNVALHPEYTGMGATADVISTELGRLATSSVDPTLSSEARADALVMMGGLMGSIQGATERFVSDAGLRAQSRVDLVRTFSDRITGNLVSRGGAVGEVAGGAVVDAFWEGFVTRAERAAQAEADDATGGLISLGQSLRAGLGEVHNLDDLRQYSDALDAYVERLNQ